MQLLSVHPVLACHDVAASVAFYSKLGFDAYFVDDKAAPKYAAVHRDSVALHLQWTGPDQWCEGLDRPAIRFTVADVEALYSEFLDALGADSMSEGPWAKPAVTPWGTIEFHLRDPGGNSLQFFAAIGG